MAYVTRLPSRMPDPPCGDAIYRATPDDPGVRVQITFIEGVHTAIIMEGEDAGEEVPVRGMVGTFQRDG